jgi:cystathionine beta-lyase
MVNYNFDKIIHRENTDSLKYDFRKNFFGKADVLPMWVADMDLPTPDFIMDAIKRRAEHPVLGYSFRSDKYYKSIIEWIETRHNWNIKKEWISYSPGVVPGLTLAVTTFTEPGDQVIVQPPVYFPFFSSVEGPGRELVYNPLLLKNGRYYFDFDDLRNKIGKKTKMLILCSPHNPGGMVWKKEELLELAEICLQNDILILSDEIHADLVFKPARHIPLASISDKIARNVITFMSPSKTFNMAALSTAYLVIPDPKLKKEYDRVTAYFHLHVGNVFGHTALEAAYRNGEEWLDQMLEYVQENIRYVVEFFRIKLPQIKPVQPEGTYLIWIDFSQLGLEQKNLKKLMIHQANIGLNDGSTFGEGGKGFLRMNVACPKAIVVEAMDRMYDAINKAGLLK